MVTNRTGPNVFYSPDVSSMHSGAPEGEYREYMRGVEGSPEVSIRVLTGAVVG